MLLAIVYFALAILIFIDIEIVDIVDFYLYNWLLFAIRTFPSSVAWI